MADLKKSDRILMSNIAYTGNIVIICGYMYSKIQYMFNMLAPATTPVDTVMLCECVVAKTG